MKIWADYLNKLNDKQKTAVVNVLNIALELSPESKAEMPYGVPGLKLNGKPLIAVAAHKQHYGIYPFSPMVIKKSKFLIGNLPTAKGTIRFSYQDTPSKELIKKLIELRTKEIL